MFDLNCNRVRLNQLHQQWVAVKCLCTWEFLQWIKKEKKKKTQNFINCHLSRAIPLHSAKKFIWHHQNVVYFNFNRKMKTKSLNQLTLPGVPVTWSINLSICSRKIKNSISRSTEKNIRTLHPAHAASTFQFSGAMWTGLDVLFLLLVSF